MWLLKATRSFLRSFQWARDAADRLVSLCSPFSEARAQQCSLILSTADLHAMHQFCQDGNTGWSPMQLQVTAQCLSTVCAVFLLPHSSVHNFTACQHRLLAPALMSGGILFMLACAGHLTFPVASHDSAADIVNHLHAERSISIKGLHVSAGLCGHPGLQRDLCGAHGGDLQAAGPQPRRHHYT